MQLHHLRARLLVLLVTVPGVSTSFSDDFGDVTHYDRAHVVECNASALNEAAGNLSDHVNHNNFFSEEEIEEILVESSFSIGHSFQSFPTTLSHMPSFAYTSILLISLAACAILSRSDTWYKVVPNSITQILVGMILGLIILASNSDDGRDNSSHLRYFSKRTFMFYILPPIIFADGFDISWPGFVKNIKTIMSHAFIGTVLNTLLIGAVVFGIAQSMWPSFRFVDGLLFGSFIAAVDPIAVISVLTKQKVNNNLTGIVNGESIFNDGMALVLFKLFVAVAYSESLAPSPTAGGVVSLTVWIAIVFVFVLVFSVLVGLLGAILAVVTCKNLLQKHFRHFQPLWLYLLGYVSYLLAESVHLSGIFAIVVYAMFVKNHSKRILRDQERTLHDIMHASADIAEIIVFFIIGVQAIALSDSYYHEHTAAEIEQLVGFIISAWIVSLVSRVICLYVVDKCTTRALQFKEILLMGWGGLRGAIAFSLAWDLIDSKLVCTSPHAAEVSHTTAQSSTTHSDDAEPLAVFNFGTEFKLATIWIVCITVLLQGSTTFYALQWLKIEKKAVSKVTNKTDDTPNNDISSDAGSDAGSDLGKERLNSMQLLTKMLATHTSVGMSQVGRGVCLTNMWRWLSLKIDVYLEGPLDYDENLDFLRKRTAQQHITTAAEHFNMLVNEYWVAHAVASQLGLETGTPSFEYVVADQVHDALKRFIAREASVQHNVQCTIQNLGFDVHEQHLPRRQTVNQVLSTRSDNETPLLSQEHAVHKRLLHEHDADLDEFLHFMVTDVLDKELGDNVNLKQKVIGRIAPHLDDELQHWLKQVNPVAEASEIRSSALPSKLNSWVEQFEAKRREASDVDRVLHGKRKDVLSDKIKTLFAHVAMVDSDVMMYEAAILKHAKPIVENSQANQYFIPHSPDFIVSKSKDADPLSNQSYQSAHHEPSRRVASDKKALDVVAQRIQSAIEFAALRSGMEHDMQHHQMQTRMRENRGRNHSRSVTARRHPVKAAEDVQIPNQKPTEMKTMNESYDINALAKGKEQDIPQTGTEVAVKNNEPDEKPNIEPAVTDVIVDNSDDATTTTATTTTATVTAVTPKPIFPDASDGLKFKVFNM
eukprot:m.195771 g.195771  ORF g.195771 m.195771 type:complete len:1103 (-) comp32586_c0_seq1:243-3551(-)